MYSIGRGLQMLALVILPFSILLNLQEALTLWQSLTLSSSGVLLFYIGYLMSGLGNKE